MENGRRLSRDHVLEKAHQVDSVKNAEMLSYSILLQQLSLFLVCPQSNGCLNSAASEEQIVIKIKLYQCQKRISSEVLLYCSVRLPLWFTRDALFLWPYEHMRF